MTMSLPGEARAGFALAVLAVALGVYLSTRLGSPDLLRLFYGLAALALLKAVFAWGAARGFPIRREDGRLHPDHLVRNLAMAFLAIPIVLLGAAPLALIAFQLAR